MTKHQTLAMIVFSAVLVTVGYQNCAKVGVADGGLSNEKLVGQGVTAAPDIDGGGSIVTLPGADLSTPAPAPTPISDTGEVIPPKVDEPAVETPSAPVLPPVAAEPPKKEVEVPAEEPAPTPAPAPAPEVQQPPVAQEPPKQEEVPPAAEEPATPAPVAEVPPVVADDKCTNPDECIIESPTAADAAALCLNSTINGKKLAKGAALSGPEVTKVRGNTVVASDSLTRVEDVRGHLVIKGKTSAATAKLIQNTRGALVICGMSVDEISDTRGQIILVNSTVKSLSNHRGQIRLMNSEITTTSDVQGSTSQLPK